MKHHLQSRNCLTTIEPGIENVFSVKNVSNCYYFLILINGAIYSYLWYSGDMTNVTGCVT